MSTTSAIASALRALADGIESELTTKTELGDELLADWERELLKTTPAPEIGDEVVIVETGDFGCGEDLNGLAGTLVDIGTDVPSGYAVRLTEPVEGSFFWGIGSVVYAEQIAPKTSEDEIVEGEILDAEIVEDVVAPDTSVSVTTSQTAEQVVAEDLRVEDEDGDFFTVEFVDTRFATSSEEAVALIALNDTESVWITEDDARRVMLHLAACITVNAEKQS